MLDPTAFVAMDVAGRMMAEQFPSEVRAPQPSRTRRPTRALRNLAARALRTAADVLELPKERTTTA
jgi:hypothetical protein